MAWRLCAAFCFAVSFGLAWLPTIERRRLHEGMRSDHWIVRANSAALVRRSDREALPRLVALLDDLNPRVRENALAALHRITGWPWASRLKECRAAWEEKRSPSREPAPAVLPPETGIELAVIRGDEGVFHVTVVNRTSKRVQLMKRELESYPALLYGPNGTAVRVLQPGQADSGVVDVAIFDQKGRGVARFWWHLGHSDLAPEAWRTETYDVNFLPPGLYVADIRLGSTLLVDEVEGAAPPLPEGLGFTSKGPVLGVSAEQKIVLLLAR